MGIWYPPLKLNFDFIRDIAPVGGIIRVPPFRPSIGASQDGPRTHRPCQGQSGQSQHGIRRHWSSNARGRGVIQLHGRD
jgi:hypothetical protein